MPRGPYSWDEAAGRYREASGKFVPFADVRRATDAAIDTARRRIVQLGTDLQTGRLSVADWQAGMQTQIRNLHGWSAAAGVGGWGQMSPAEWGRVGNALKFQYRKLNDFARQIAGGLPLDGRFLRRVELYALAGKGTHDSTVSRTLAVRGFDEEWNVLGANEHHCEGAESCIEETRKGAVPIGTLKPIGTRRCLGRCQCTVVRRNSRTGEVAR